MRELSIEQKAQRYDEAIERAESIYNETAIPSATTKGICTYIFPELKESEGEKIRKWIIGVLSTYEHDRDLRNAAITWLEKQGEQKSYSSETMNEKGDFDNGFTRMMEKEQKPADKVEPKFKVGDKIQYLKGCGTIMTIEKIENDEYIFANNMGHTSIEDGNKWYLVEQNWSEEDEVIINSIISFCDFKVNIELHNEEVKNASKNILSWLNKLKYRVQPKQEWGEEDENAIQVFKDIVKYSNEINENIYTMPLKERQLYRIRPYE